MSALPPEADIRSMGCDVPLSAKSDIERNKSVGLPQRVLHAAAMMDWSFTLSRGPHMNSAPNNDVCCRLHGLPLSLNDNHGSAISHDDDPTAASCCKRRNNYIRVAPNCGVVCTKKPIKPSTRSRSTLPVRTQVARPNRVAQLDGAAENNQTYLFLALSEAVNAINLNQ